MQALARREAATSLCEGVVAGFLDPTGFGLATAGVKFFAALWPERSFEKRVEQLVRRVEKTLPEGTDFGAYEVETARALLNRHLPRARPRPPPEVPASGCEEWRFTFAC